MTDFDLPEFKRGLKLFKRVESRTCELSICKCGHPALHDEIGLGTTYIIYPQITTFQTFICGGCGVKVKYKAVLTLGRCGSDPGYLPCGIFEEY